MAVRALTILKSWFETGDKPTQSQFWDWLDSFYHKDEQIDQAAVSGLTNSLNDKADLSVVNGLFPVVLTGSSSSVSHAAEGGKILHKVRVKSDADMASFKIGTVVNGAQIMGAEAIEAGLSSIFTLDADLENPTTLYFSGLTGNWSIKIVFQ